MRGVIPVAAALILAGCAATGPRPDEARLVVPRGTALRVRVGEPLNTRHNRAGDIFRATLETALAVDGRTVLPAGTTFLGRVAESRFDGRQTLALALDRFRLEGRDVPLRAVRIEREAAHSIDLVAASASGHVVGLPAEAVVTFLLESPLRL